MMKYPCGNRRRKGRGRDREEWRGRGRERETERERCTDENCITKETIQCMYLYMYLGLTLVTLP